LKTLKPIGKKRARERLLQLLREFAFEQKPVLLSSGKESNFFIDCKKVTLRAEGHSLVGEVLLDELSRLPTCEAVAGVELGGCPLASAVVMSSYRSKPIDAIYVRKEAKEHGSKQMIEGGSHLEPNSPGVLFMSRMGDIEGGSHLEAHPSVVLLEDVVTTGGSTIKAAAELWYAGFDVVGVIALVDRLEGGRQAIEKAGIPFLSVFTKDDFMV